MNNYPEGANFTIDYYPFGQEMPGRVYSPASYRYGFNGKENDNEVAGTGNWQNYGMREYDARVCRFISVDPLTKDYPWYTPYQFAGNSPILFVDLDGAEPAKRNYTQSERQDLFGDINQTFVSDPYWTGINSASQVYFIRQNPDSKAWERQKVCEGDASLPIYNLVYQGLGHYEMNKTSVTSYNIGFVNNKDVFSDNTTVVQNFNDIAQQVQNNPGLIVQIQGNTYLSSGQNINATIGGVDYSGTATSDALVNARAQTIYQGLTSAGVPEANIQIVPGSYGTTTSTTINIQQPSVINLPPNKTWSDIQDVE